ncbi:MAG: alpha/beta hydrolase [Desulfatitalea sp. BRH_c12]|nr:MAG: alpha/beta hydrolase [Desulfatitalea sp. BRH_c12]
MQNTELSVGNVTVPVNGSQLSTHYLAAGEGSPIVLLHGLGDSAYSWQWVIEPLALKHRVYAVSFPGFGRSAKPQASYSPDFFTAFTDAFLDVMGIDTTALVGNSLGGLIAFRVAMRKPERINALGLVSSAGLGSEVSLVLRLLTLPVVGKMVTAWNKTAIGAYQWAMLTTVLLFAHPTRAPRVWSYGLKKMARMPGYLEATVASAKQIGSVKGQREQQIILDELEALKIPTAVLWGEKDRVVPLQHAHAAFSRIPNGRMIVFEECGHLPHIEAANQFVRAVDTLVN